MKNFLIYITLFFFPFLGIFAQKTYYISTEGNDLTGDGSFDSPWASWQMGTNNAEPGDTVYIRGGVYYPSERLSKYTSGIWSINPNAGYGKSGTKDKWIYYIAYPDDYEKGDFPILDISKADLGSHNFAIGLSVGYSQFIYFKGLTIRNVWQNKNASAPEAYGVSTNRSANLRFENMTVHNIGGRGWWIQGGAWSTGDSAYAVDVNGRDPQDARILIDYDTTIWINCDTYNVCDSIDYTGAGDPGNSADCWKTVFYAGNVAKWIGCRTWNFTDDGWDPSISARSYEAIGPKIYLENCWSMSTDKYLEYCNENAAEGKGGIEGNGFKFGAAGGNTPKEPAGYFINCLAIYNYHDGFSSNVELNRGNFDMQPQHYNNTSYRNGAIGFHIEFASGIERNFTFKNNLTYGNLGLEPGTKTPYDVGTGQGYYVESHNVWDRTDNYPYFSTSDTFDLNNDDFVTLDSVEVNKLFKAPRKSDGSLPSFPLQLKSSSDLVDAGTDIGLPYKGKAPDIGAFEYGTVSVELVSPTDSSKYLNSNSIPFKAVATDTEGNIDRVLFYTKKKEIKLGEGISIGDNQWQFDWETDTIGFFDLRAVAINQAGDSATSSRIHVFIYPEDGPGEKDEQNCEVRYFEDNQQIRVLLQEPLSVTTDLYIVSVDGKIRKTITLKQTDFFKDINISDIVPGFYILQFEKTEGTAVCNGSKFVKVIN